MVIGIAKITLHIFDCQSLKEKRRVVNSLLHRLRNRFNAAIAEIDDQDLWQKSTIGAAVIGGSTAHASSQLQSIVDFVESQPLANITAIETEIL
ncbi:MAG: DUF503 domain-containing protein [Firmicutes bacterium]|nr:DUF503 domain-containing protein [Bacillota bacterium]